MRLFVKNITILGSRIINNNWSPNKFLNEDPKYICDNIYHGENFVDPDDNSIHTQTIELCWMHCKQILKKKFVTLEHLLYEYTFRKGVSSKEKILNEPLILIIRIIILFNNVYS